MKSSPARRFCLFSSCVHRVRTGIATWAGVVSSFLGSPSVTWPTWPMAPARAKDHVISVACNGAGYARPASAASRRDRRPRQAQTGPRPGQHRQALGTLGPRGGCPPKAVWAPSGAYGDPAVAPVHLNCGTPSRGGPGKIQYLDFRAVCGRQEGDDVDFACWRAAREEPWCAWIVTPIRTDFVSALCLFPD